LSVVKTTRNGGYRIASGRTARLQIARNAAKIKK